MWIPGSIRFWSGTVSAEDCILPSDIEGLGGGYDGATGSVSCGKLSAFVSPVRSL